VLTLINHRDLRDCAEISNERALRVQMSAVSCSNRVRELVKAPTNPEESHERPFASLANNEQVLAHDQSAVHASKYKRRRGLGHRARIRSAVSWGGAPHEMEDLTDDAATRGLRRRRVRRQVAGDSGPAGTDRPVFAQA